MEREVANRLAVGISYTFVRGQNLVRARDINLPSPTNVTYPVYDAAGVNLLGYYNVDSFSTWQYTQTLNCPYPPCINPLARPIPQLGAIDVFESEASSAYHGATLSINRRMTNGFYFRLAYTYAHAMDDGQDALVAGEPALVQNSYSPKSEYGPSVTDQRQRFAISWIADPKLFGRDQPILSKMFNSWKAAGVVTVGSGRPINATVTGDPNQDGNDENDRLPGVSRNGFVGPDYASTDVRLTRRIYTRDRWKLEFIAESFNLLNRDNPRVQITSDGFVTNSAQFIQSSKTISSSYYPAYYQVPTSFTKATAAYAPRQVQLALRLSF